MYNVKSHEELLTMNVDSLKDYFIVTKVSKKDLIILLESFDIKIRNLSRQNLIDFASREISNMGIYKRIAQGYKN